MSMNVFTFLECWLLQLVSFSVFFLGFWSWFSLLFDRRLLDRQWQLLLLLVCTILSWCLCCWFLDLLWFQLGLRLLSVSFNWYLISCSFHLRLSWFRSRHFKAHRLSQGLGLTLRALSFRLLWGRGRLSRLWWRLRNLDRCWRQGRGLHLSCLLRLGEGCWQCWLGRWSLSLCRRIGGADLIHSEQILLLLLSLLKLSLYHCLLFLRLPDLLLDRRLLSGLGGRWCS